MSFKFTCPHCNQTIECENKFEGMTAPCPRCREIVELKRNTHVPPKPQEPELKREHEEQHSETPKSAPEKSQSVQTNGSTGPRKNRKVEYKKQRFLPTLFQICGALNLLVAFCDTLDLASNNPSGVFGALQFFSIIALASGGIFAFVLATVLDAVCDTRDYTKEMRDMMKEWLDSKER